MQVKSYTLNRYQIEIVPSGAHGWFDFYVDGKPWGCAKAAQLKRRIEQVIDLKEAAYQPQIVLDAITNALSR